MVLAKLTVSGVSACAVYKKKIPQGIIGATIELDYTDPMWAGLKKTMVFWGSSIKDVLDIGTVVTIPAEVVAKAGSRLRVGIYGVDMYENTVIPTLWADLGPIEGSADPSLDPTAKDELPVWAQLQAQIGDLAGLQTETKASLVAAINEMVTGFDEYDKAQVQRITDLLHEALQEAKDSGDFDGPPGPAGPAGADGKDGADGAPGADGKTPVKGVDYFTDADKQEIVEAVLDAMPESEDGVSSWNDLPDKPFGEESGTEVVLAEQAIDGFADDGSGVYGTAISALFVLVADKEYHVVWDGEEYICVSYESDAQGIPAVMLGNKAAVTEGSSELTEPFTIAYVPNYELNVFSAANGSTDASHTVAVYQDIIIIKTLDSKYLPMDAIDARIEEYISAALEVDLSAYESEGKIVETYADGSVVTTVMEFDSNGKPTKITDSNGNVTVLTW